MWKTLRYVLYFTILISVFSVTYNFREYCYVPYIQKVVSKVDSNIKFRTFSVKFPFKLILHDVEYGGKLFINKTELRFEPNIFFQNIKSPLKSLSFVKINKITYVDERKEKISPHEEKTAFQKIKINFFTKLLSLFNVNCEVDRVDALIKNKVIRMRDVNFTLNKEIDFGAEIFYSKIKMKTKGNLKLDGTYITSDFYSETDGSVKSKFELFGNYNLFDDNFALAILLNFLLLIVAHTTSHTLRLRLPIQHLKNHQVLDNNRIHGLVFLILLDLQFLLKPHLLYKTLGSRLSYNQRSYLSFVNNP